MKQYFTSSSYFIHPLIVHGVSAAIVERKSWEEQLCSSFLCPPCPYHA